MLDFLNAPQLRDTICASFTSPFPTTFPPRFILTRPLVLSKNTSTSRPLNSLPRYLPSRPKQPLWVLTFQTQSFQSCSLAVIFIFSPPRCLTAPLHVVHCPRFGVVCLPLPPPFSTSRLQHLFFPFHPPSLLTSRFPPSSLVYPRGDTNSHLILFPFPHSSHFFD